MDAEKIVSKIPERFFMMATIIFVLLLLILFFTGKHLSLNPIGFIDPLPSEALMREKEAAEQELTNLKNALKEQNNARNDSNADTKTNPDETVSKVKYLEAQLEEVRTELNNERKRVAVFKSESEKHLRKFEYCVANPEDCNNE